MTFDIVEALTSDFEVTLLFFKHASGHDIPLCDRLSVETILAEDNKIWRNMGKILRRLIERSREHDVVVAGLELWTTYLSVTAARITQRPIIAISHTELLKWMETDRYSSFHKPISKIIYNLTNRVVAVSEIVADHLYSHFGVPTDKLHVIYNPINITRLTRLSGEDSEWLPIESGVIVAIGRLSPQKGFDVLIRAISKITVKNPHLIIIGDGHIRPELEMLAKRLNLEDRVHFVGFLKNPYSVLKQAVAFVLPSRYEGFGIVLAEAMALGVPIVASRLPVFEEITRNGRCGLLVDREDPEALARGIEHVLSNSNANSCFVANGLERCKDFNIITIGGEWKSLLNEICTSNT